MIVNLERQGHLEESNRLSLREDNDEILQVINLDVKDEIPCEACFEKLWILTSPSLSRAVACSSGMQAAVASRPVALCDGRIGGS